MRRLTSCKRRDLRADGRPTTSPALYAAADQAWKIDERSGRARQGGGTRPESPCWIDTAQPDPEAAVRFYGGLFGWEFEDRMPSDASGNYFVARLRDRDVAAVGSPYLSAQGL